MTSGAVAVARAFSRTVSRAGLLVRAGQAVEPVLVLLEVLDPRSSDHRVAVFEVADNEYVGLRLDNGAHFWEHEWDQRYQEAFARLLGEAVVAHVAGAGTYDTGGRVYRISIGSELLQTRDRLDLPGTLK